MSDVLVYGATAAGVMAAVAAREAGARVTLVETGRHIGGMVSGGLSWTDVGDARVTKGLALRFYEAVAAHYDAPLWAVKGPEPHVAEALLTSMLDRAGVDVRLGQGAHVHQASLKGQTLQDPLTPRAAAPAASPSPEAVQTVRKGKTLQDLLMDVAEAAVYVDASYEGDLMAALGVPYAVGREARGLYGETWAGRQPATRPGKHNFPVLLSPFDEAGALLPFIREPELDERGWPRDGLGEGDGGLQAYGFRVCLTDRDENRLPIEQPRGYDPGAFELLRRYLEAGGDRLRGHDLLGLVPGLLPNGKCDVNSIGPFSLNLLDGSNRAYPDGDDATRAQVRDHHLRYAHALLYYLAGDDGVPRRVRDDVGRWGLCADEFTDTGGWPHQLYVRDGRRMLGEYVVREQDLSDARAQPDTVALGSYNIDIREVERTWRYLPEYERTAAVFNEGYLSAAVPPYPIPYRSLVPRREDATNLLVPVCLSASHVAFGSVRTEPTLMALGHAAGAAAAQAARRDVAVQDVRVEELAL